VKRIFLCLILFLYSFPVRASFTCSNGDEETFLPLAVCAVSVGGCKVIKDNFGFVAGEACDAAVSKLVGMGYDVKDLMTSLGMEGLDKAIDEYDGESDTVGNLLGGAILATKYIYCQDQVRQICVKKREEAYYRSNPQPAPLPYVPPVPDYKKIINAVVFNHFSNGKNCQVDAMMKFYNSHAYYEGQLRTIEEIKKIKLNYCSKHRDDSLSSFIKGNFLSIDENIGGYKDLYEVRYDVGWSFLDYKEGRQVLRSGYTKVFLFIMFDGLRYSIISEAQKKMVEF
jgi:predicted transposase YbfD/YdcC